MKESGNNGSDLQNSSCCHRKGKTSLGHWSMNSFHTKPKHIETTLFWFNFLNNSQTQNMKLTIDTHLMYNKYILYMERLLPRKKVVDRSGSMYSPEETSKQRPKDAL